MAARYSPLRWRIRNNSTQLRKKRRRRSPRRLQIEPLEGRIVLAASSLVSPAWFATVTDLPAAELSTSAFSTSAVSGSSQSTSTDTFVATSFDWIVHFDAAALNGVSSVADAAQLLAADDFDVDVIRGLGMEGQVLVRSAGAAAETVAEWFSASPVIDAFEQDAVVQLNRAPNELTYPTQLWGLTKIDAASAWDISTGSSNVIVGVIDTGVNYNHPDLAGNMWRNPGEVAGDGVDNDRNGFVDDVFGWDFANNDNNPMDDDNHGTHVAGTIGGVGNNGLGVVGVNWDVSIMALKFLGADGNGSTSDAVRAVNYATMMRQQFGQNVRVTNNSWGGGGASRSLINAINNGGNAGILFAAAAGNEGRNTDASPHYPSASNSPYIVSVAATDANDNLASFSNYGRTTVDLAAPGVSIRSSVASGGYANYSGTSMATPHVAGVAALAWSVAPNASVAEIRQALLDSVDPIAGLTGAVASGGRLNAFKTLQAVLGGDPVAGDDAVTTSLNNAVAINVLANDLAGSGGNLAVVGVTQGASGSVAVNPNNTVSYTPSTGFVGDDSFTYTIRNTAGREASGTVTVTVTPPLETLTFASNQQAAISSSGTPTVTSNLTVNGVSGAVYDVNVIVDITHSWVSDLQITAIAPNGSRVVLADNRGDNGDGYSGTVFDDEATTPIGAGIAPFVGSFTPEQSLAALDGVDPNGTWTLEVADQADRDGGVIRGWSLEITSEVPPANDDRPTGSISLEAEADTFVAGGSRANTRYGGSAALFLKKGSNAASSRQAYVRFATPAAGASIQNATLLLTPRAFKGSYQSLVFRVRLVDDSGDGWIENSTTWNNRPIGSGAEVLVDGSQLAIGEPFEMDVTSLLGQALHANDLLTFHIDVVSSPNGSPWVKFESRERPDENVRPRFELTYAEPVTSSIKLQAGVLHSVDNTGWTTVTLPQSYQSMVVVATPVVGPGDPPLTTRIQNAAGNSFQIMVQRVDGSNAALGGVPVQYAVVEAGVYTAAEHGVTLEAVTFISAVTDGSNRWQGQRRSYANAYAHPVVLGQVMTYRDPEPSLFWSRGANQASAPDSNTFYAGKHIGEDSNRSRADELIGYIVIEAGSGTIDGVNFAAGLGPDTIRGVDNGTYSYNISGLASATSAVVSQAGMDGGNGSWATLYGSNAVSGSTLKLVLQEDQLADSERSHTTESVAYWAFDTPGASAHEQAPATPAVLLHPWIDENGRLGQIARNLDGTSQTSRNLNSVPLQPQLRFNLAPIQLHTLQRLNGRGIESDQAAAVDQLFEAWDLCDVPFPQT